MHEYSGVVAKIEIEIPFAEAKRLMNDAVAAVGRYPLRVSMNGAVVEAMTVGARLDSFDNIGRRVGGTGVIEFSSLKMRT